MANVSIDSAFAGIEDATVEDKNPDVPPLTVGKGRVEMVKVDQSRRNAGLFMVIEFMVLESSNPACVVGMRYKKSITRLDGPDKKLKFGQVLSFLGAVFKTDPESAEFKAKAKQLIQYCTDKGAANGREFTFETGPLTKAKESGKHYTPFTFRAC